MNIIVTGAGKGIGYETALKLLTVKGNKVIVVSRDLSSWQNSTDPDVILLHLDLVQTDAAVRIAEFAKSVFGTVDILINNAGFLVNKRFEELTSDDFDRQFTTNVKSAFLCIQALLPLFSKGSHILNISSMGGFQGSVKFPGLSLYSASKAALASLTECLAAEFHDAGIRFNCLALGAAQTDMLSAAFPGYKAPVTATEMADFIVYFAMNGQKYFNGKIIPVALGTP